MEHVEMNVCHVGLLAALNEPIKLVTLFYNEL